MFQQQQQRGRILDRQILLFTDAIKGLGCDTPRKLWQTPMNEADKARCRTYRQDLKTLQKLEWEYYIHCYDGPGQECEQEIPK